LSEGLFVRNRVVQIPKFDAKPNPKPDHNPSPSPMPIRFGQMTLRTRELSPSTHAHTAQCMMCSSCPAFHRESQLPVQAERTVNEDTSTAMIMYKSQSNKMGEPAP